MGTPGVPPTPAPEVVDPGKGGLEAADAAARDRLAAAFPDPLQPGAPADVAAAAAAPPAADAPFDIFDPDAIDKLDLGSLQYRDGAKLAKDIAAARDKFKPLNDAFGGLDDAQRAALVAAAPTLGADLAVFGQVGSQLHPDDRAWFMGVMGEFATDPLGAAKKLAAGASAIQANYVDPAAPPAPAADPNAPPSDDSWIDPDAAPADPANAPVTRADLEAYMNQQRYEADVRSQEQAVLAAAAKLGYSPNPNDPIADNRFDSFIGMARRTGGDLDKAHQLMQAQDQAIIDGFVQAKAADADRPGTPATGGPPVDTQVLDTLPDAQQSMLNRLEGALGPDPRRRGAED